MCHYACQDILFFTLFTPIYTVKINKYIYIYTTYIYIYTWRTPFIPSIKALLTEGKCSEEGAGNTIGTV